MGYLGFFSEKLCRFIQKTIDTDHIMVYYIFIRTL